MVPGSPSWRELSKGVPSHAQEHPCLHDMGRKNGVSGGRRRSGVERRTRPFLSSTVQRVGGAAAGRGAAGGTRRLCFHTRSDVGFLGREGEPAEEGLREARWGKRRLFLCLTRPLTFVVPPGVTAPAAVGLPSEWPPLNRH